ncbi:MAG: TIR domain-containing protein [Sphingomonadaceae bacterium]|nr:TIR domain-containing protein [Sphingomonadaceae bacterium]
MAEPARADIRYTAFLSYSHKDAAAAGRLHRRLEAYRIPRRLVGKDSPYGPVPPRLWPIFRDREELPAATDLSETVRAALAQSGALIILCSPHAAGSLWVAEEIETFRRLHPDRPILAAILDGDPADCFPKALRAYGQDGTWHEPLATDLRRGKDGSHLGLLKLVAGITGLGLDDLVQRDASRRVRRITTLGTLALIGTVVMAVLAILAFEARREAEAQRAEAERQRAGAEGLIEYLLTDLRDKLRGVGNVGIMIDVNRRAFAYYAEPAPLGGLSPDSLERRARILHALGEDERVLGHVPAALRAFREAHRITGELLARAPNDPERIFGHAQSEYWLASIDQMRGNNSAALMAYRRYRSEAERINRLRPNQPRYLGELAFSESDLGIAHMAFGRYQEARRHFEISRMWFDRVAQLEPSNRRWRSESADAHGWVSDTLYFEHRYREAYEERQQSLQILRQLANEDPHNRAYYYMIMIATRTLGRIDMQLHQYARASVLLDEARAGMMRLLTIDSDNIDWRDQATRIEANRAELFLDTGRRNEAAGALHAARQLFNGTLLRNGASSPEHLQLSRQLAALQMRYGNGRRH